MHRSTTNDNRALWNEDTSIISSFQYRRRRRRATNCDAETAEPQCKEEQQRILQLHSTTTNSRQHRLRKNRRLSSSNNTPLVAIVSALLLVATTLFYCEQHHPVNAFHQSTAQRQRRTPPSIVSSSWSSSCVFLSVATTTSSTMILHGSIPTKSQLESMKVVDLKQLIKDSDLNERGLFTKLKKKQDLVDYLVQAAAEANGAAAPTTKRKQPLKMPRAVPVEKSDNNNNNNDDKEQAEPAQKASSSSPHPLQVIYDRVHEQYPSLKYLAEGNSTLLGEQDIRQRYHPMLQSSSSSSSKRTNNNNNVDVEEEEEYQKPALSGDMDLIFVGTASCTPSITRGVSCTALRLHSLASSASVTNKKQQQQQQTMNVNGKEQRFDVAGSSQSNLGTWLFDCGESTQLQIQKTSSVRPSKITKIFLTHAHGDHSFGLPGLLCLMGQDNSESKGPKAPIDIYGPEGLRLWLRTALRYSVSRICPKYRVHELKDVAMAPEWGYSRKWERYFFNKNVYYEREKGGPNTNNDSEYYWGAANNRRMECPPSSDWLSHLDRNGNLQPSELYGEVEGGRDIYPIYDHPLSSDGAPVYEVENEGDDGVKVYAAPMSHGVPCVGYVVQEADRPGRLRDELVKPICQRNIQALREAGFRHPMKALAVIKDLPEGGSFTFPDGTVVTQEDAVEPTRPGRKVVVCGDTNSARSMEKLAKNADVVVHEATNTYLPALDHRDATHSSVTKDTIFHGHSTPVMAGEFSRKVGAKRLILNHFSARYTGDQSLDSMSIMSRIEDQAIKASGLDKTKVAAAWDFMIYPIPKADRVVEEEDE